MYAQVWFKHILYSKVCVYRFLQVSINGQVGPCTVVVVVVVIVVVVVVAVAVAVAVVIVVVVDALTSDP